MVTFLLSSLYVYPKSLIENGNVGENLISLKTGVDVDSRTRNLPTRLTPNPYSGLELLRVALKLHKKELNHWGQKQE